MSFSDCVSGCMSPLPAPTMDGIGELMEWIERVHRAWEDSGGDEEMLVGALVAAGAVTGVDEAALGAAAGATVLAYLATLAACAASCAGSAVWDAITASNDTYAKNLITVAANDAGISKDSGIA